MSIAGRPAAHALLNLHGSEQAGRRRPAPNQE